MSNPRAQHYTKKDAKVALAQERANADGLNQLKQMVFSMLQGMIQLEGTVDRLKSTARAADYRARAIARCLDIQMPDQGIPESAINDMIVTLQEEDFEHNSRIDDQQKGLEPAMGPAQEGQVVITTIRMFKGGVELKDERIVRSKVALLKDTILNAAFDANILGMNVGDSKRVADPLGNGAFDEAEITLLGLRQKKTDQSQEQDKSQEA